jgi:site-specific DNA-methyltransferase (adenine-specific)
MTWQLHEGDCLEVMPTLPDHSIDMILCDLPYGTTACSWDVVIPFEPLWAQYKRLIKPRGAIVLTGSQPFTTLLIASNLEMFKYCWVWEKTKPSDHINAKNKPLKAHEDVAVFSNGTTANRSENRMIYNPQDLVYAPGRKERKSTISSKKGGVIGFRPCHVSSYDYEYTNYPKSILRVPNPNNDTIHPTQKPVALFEYLIRTYTNPGETILDNCAGSGTTGEAAEHCGRNSILIEREPKYCAVIRERLSKIQKPLLAS